MVPLLIIISVTLIDQITKIWAVDFLSLRGSVEVLGNFFMLTLVYNEGGALGTSFGPSFYYLATSLVILAFVLFYIYSSRNEKIMAYPLSFIAGGALGNIIDRIRIDKVIDWIDIDFFDINIFGYELERWWTFNLADAAISCSILFLLISMLMAKFSGSNHPNKKSTSNVESAPSEM